MMLYNVLLNLGIDTKKHKRYLKIQGRCMSENAITIVNNNLSVEYLALTLEKEMVKQEANEGIRDVMRAAIESTPDVVKALKPEMFYKIKSMPDGSVLFVDKAGNLTGTCIKDGKFAGHIRLEKMGPQVAQLIKGIGQQIVLIHIANELREIKAGIQQIQSGMHDDRVAKVNAGIKLLDRANDTESLRLCILPLQEGILQLEKEIQSDLLKIPTLKAGFFDNWFGESKTEELSRFYIRFSESFCAVVKGYEALIKCYVALQNQSEASQKVVYDLKAFMESLDYQRILELCRHLPRFSYPEEIWRRLNISEKRNEYFDKLEMVASPQFAECCVVISGKELKELCYEL